MLSKEKMDRINHLAKKKKEIGLNENELREQEDLRREYLAAFRTGFSNHIEGIKIVDSEGNDLTPDKIKAIQKEKGLHQE